MELTQEEIEIIERHLEATLPEHENTKLLQRIENDADFRQAVIDHKEFYWGMKALALRSKLKQIHGNLQNKGIIEQEDSIIDAIIIPIETTIPDTTPSSTKPKSRADKGKIIPFKISFARIASAAVVVIGVTFVMNLYLQNAKSKKLFESYYGPETIASLEIIHGNSSSVERAYVTGDYSDALNEIKNRSQRGVLSDYDKYMYGLNYLGLKKSEQAIQYLKMATTSKNQKIRESAFWYLGLAYLLEKDRKNARKAFQKIVEGEINEQDSEGLPTNAEPDTSNKSSYKAKAKVILKKI